ncbi:MAG TPA: hypothetical protein VID04_04290 [Methylomirabilota bacterium]
MRLIYAGFVLLVVPGFVSQLGFQWGRIGVTPSAVAAYYRGSESGDVMTFPKSWAQLLEVTHAHAFMMAVVFLVLAHLFVSTSAPDRLKRVVLAATFAGTLGDLVAPWLVRYGAPWCAWILLLSWAAQGAGSLTMLGMSGWECLGVANGES